MWKGPLVRKQPRKRNKDGTWRKKRSDAGKKRIVNKEELIELLADKEHDSWSRWMKYLFSKCDECPERSGLVIPADLVERWKDLAELPYSHLSELSKQSDRDEVAHILPIIEAFFGDKHE